MKEIGRLRNGIAIVEDDTITEDKTTTIIHRHKMKTLSNKEYGNTECKECNCSPCKHMIQHPSGIWFIPIKMDKKKK